MDRDTYLLSILPTVEVKCYRAMKAYGCHYRVLEEPNTIAYTTYDSGLIAVAEEEVGGNSWRRIEMGYVEELEAIYELNYGGTSEVVILMKGRWVQPKWTGTRCTMKRDADGLLLVNFNRAVLTVNEPFAFLGQVEQAFFLDVEE